MLGLNGSGFVVASVFDFVIEFCRELFLFSQSSSCILSNRSESYLAHSPLLYSHGIESVPHPGESLADLRSLAPEIVHFRLHFFKQSSHSFEVVFFVLGQTQLPCAF